MKLTQHYSYDGSEIVLLTFIGNNKVQINFIKFY